MEFDKSRVYTALNADELKVGSKVFLADDLSVLKKLVRMNSIDISTIRKIRDETYKARFVDSADAYMLAYLIDEPEEEVLKWTDLKLLDIIKHKYDDDTAVVTRLSNSPSGTTIHVCVGGEWLSDEELKELWEKVRE